MRGVWRGAAIGAVVAAIGITAWAATGCASGAQRARATTAGAPAGAIAPAVSAADTTPAAGTTPSVPPTRVVPPAITVAAVGDMCFDSAPKRLIRAQGGAAPFAAVASRLRSADVTVGNLECPLSTRGAPVAGKTYTFQGDPRATAGLASAGFDLVSLANNHARDYGTTALLDTFGYLRKAGIAWAGAGANRTAAWTPAIITRKGARIAYLGFSEITPANFVATNSSPGTAYTYDIAKVCAAIRAAHAKADYVVVSFHWGVERQYTPTARQVSDGRAAVRAGADLVLSHHPHVVQGVEFYRRGLIAYSLGNFVFSPGNVGGRDTIILHATMTPSGVASVSVEPCYIGTNGRPVPASGSAAARILAVVKRTSSGRGTIVRIAGTNARLLP